MDEYPVRDLDLESRRRAHGHSFGETKAERYFMEMEIEMRVDA